MTPEQRQHLRRMIDQRKRELTGLHTTHQGTCKGCNMPYDHHTPGCQNCDDRARRRRKRDNRPIEVLPEHCVGCGIHWHQYTHGCPTCIDRRRNRNPERRRRIAIHKHDYRQRLKQAA